MILLIQILHKHLNLLEIITVSRSTYAKSSTFSDPSINGAITSLALSPNSVYLASSSSTGLCIWSTENRRLLFRFQGSVSSPICQLAWSPKQNLLAWVDTEGVLTRWNDPVPPESPDPVRAATATVTKQGKRKSTPTLFDAEADAGREPRKEAKDVDAAISDVEEGDDVAMDDDWILDDLGGGMEDDEGKKELGSRGGVREMGKANFS